MLDSLDNAVRDALWEAARCAILPRFRPGEAIAADYKAIGEAVTAADRESEAILAELLGALMPGAEIVGEEASHGNAGALLPLGRGTCWIIDPLDGTANFAAGKRPFGMLVALAVDGVPHGGWILDPVTGRLCAARRGRGAWIDGEPFRVQARSSGERPTVAVTRLFAHEMQRSAIIAAINGECEVVNSPRCAADQYPRVATGGNDATLFTRTIAWDHAAGVIFLNEAGGAARRPDGSAYRCEDADGGLIIATCPQRWDQVAALVALSEHGLAGAHLPNG